MKQRFLGSLVALAPTALPHLSGQTASSSMQKKPAVATKMKAGAIPRTANGHPDFEGIWNNAPAEFEGKLSLTDAETAMWERQRLETSDADRRGPGRGRQLVQSGVL